MMVGGDAEAVERLSPILDVLAPRPTSRASRRSARAAGCTSGRRRRPLREDGPQRHRVRPDAGLRRGLRRLAAQVPSTSSTTRRDRRTSGGRARSSARGCSNSPRAPSKPTATSCEAIEGYVEDSGEGRWTIADAIDARCARAGASPRRSSRASARAQRAILRANACSRRCATSSAATPSRAAAARKPGPQARRALSRARAAGPSRPLRRSREPAVAGLERLPVAPTHAGDLRRHGRPGPAQTAAGALQPRARGRACPSACHRRRLA